ncbi:hypothetical protein WDW89_18135 [Deltaproteobacteria bacterium TL4]
MYVFQKASEQNVRQGVGQGMKTFEDLVLSQFRYRCAICNVGHLSRGKGSRLKVYYIDSNALNENDENLLALCLYCQVKAERESEDYFHNGYRQVLIFDELDYLKKMRDIRVKALRLNGGKTRNPPLGLRRHPSAEKRQAQQMNFFEVGLRSRKQPSKEVGSRSELLELFNQTKMVWDEEDITAMFAQSPLGSEMLMQRFVDCGSEILRLYLEIDAEHKRMMIEYIIQQYYPSFFDTPPKRELETKRLNS